MRSIVITNIRPILVCGIAAGLVAGPLWAQARVVESGNGTVRDRTSGLEWAGADNGSDVNWGEADAYCKGLELTGASDWRLPSRAELEGLFEAVADRPLEMQECGMTSRLMPGIKTTCAMFWSSTLDLEGSGRQAFAVWFENGKAEASPMVLGGLTRALCVRGG